MKTKPTTTTELTDALAAYRVALSERDELAAEYAPIVQLMSEHEQTVADAKALILDLLNAHDLSYIEDDSFEVTRVVSDRGTYNANKLPKSVEIMDACDISISKSAVKKLIKSGILAPDEAEAAWESAPATPYLRIKIKTEN